MLWISYIQKYMYVENSWQLCLLPGGGGWYIAGYVRQATARAVHSTLVAVASWNQGLGSGFGPNSDQGLCISIEEKF